MMRKRWGCFLLCAGLLIGTIPVSYAADVQQQAETTQDEKSGTCGEHLTWTLDDNGTLTVSGTGRMEHFFTGWSDYAQEIKKVILPEGLTSIGESAFSNCVNLKEISIPESVVQIEYYAFRNTALTADSANWENGICYIDGWAVEVKKDLENCVLGGNTRGIQMGVFDNCKELRTVTVLDGARAQIPEELFQRSENLESVRLSSGITKIGNHAFSECKNLKEVILPEGIACIDDYAFYGCTGLTEVVIPGSVREFGYSIFKNCSALNRVTLPNNLEEIPSAIFSGCTALQNIDIPSSVKTIEQYAFKGSGLLEIDIPEGVSKIGGNAFRSCNNLRQFSMPDSVTILGENVFTECAMLEDVELSSNIENIALYMFSYCKNLKHLDIPEGVSNIDLEAFRGSGLVEISFPSTLKRINSYAFEDCKDLKNIYYYGTESMFDNIQISEEGNAPLLNADVYIMMPFVDVPMSQYYAYPVMWAVANDITSGVDATHFAPNKSCTRAEIVTFLWNAAGRPSVNTNNPFKDVKKSDWYYQAVQWAVSENITAGVKRDEFAPSKTCTRAEVMTFLWNAEGQPTAQIKSPFKDVNTSDWFYQPVCWAVSESITAGTSPTTFGSKDACTRAHVVTFLHNYLDA